MAKKAPRRTAQRIQEVALALFNRYGEPHVSTTLIANELGISAGNLYYHYPAKEVLVNALFDDYAKALDALLPAAGEVRDVEDTWFFMHSLFELIWQHRFLYRDLTLLLSSNRHLEQGIQRVLQHKQAALLALLSSLQRAGALYIPAPSAQQLATNAVVMLSYWLSFEYALNPRHALEPEGVQNAVLRGAAHALGLLLPYLESSQQAHMLQLITAYTPNSPTELAP